MKYNIWNKWDPLEVCMLGNNYAPEFFNGLNTKAEYPLKRICEETLEDLQGFKNVLQDFGVEVIQPELDSGERFIDNPHRYPRGPLQPRDHQIVIGNKCYSSNADHPAIVETLDNYSDVNSTIVPWTLDYPAYITENTYTEVAGASFPSYEEFIANKHNKSFFEDFVWEELIKFSRCYYNISGATAFLLGKRIVVGNIDSEYNYSHKEIKHHFPVLKDCEIIETDIGGHSDGSYHPIKPGAILSLHDVQNYKETFPGWDVCYLPDQSWHKVDKFNQLKKKNAGKWWLAGEEDNDEFTNFVETWLQDWVGYVEETVFDVNVLMLDEHHCCVSNPNNQKVNSFLKKHNIEPVYIPFRHRYFWDGGLHCITLDLYRQGTQKEYFK